MASVSPSFRVAMGLWEDVRAPVTLAIAALIPLLWLLGALLTPTNQHGVFALSIASVILEHIRPWAYLTAPFYHQYLWEVVCIVPLTVLLGVRVEKHLGSLAMARLMLFVGVVSTGLLFCDMFALYIVFRNPFFLRTGVSGFTGGLVALLVALAHENPNQTLYIPKLAVKHYPLFVSLVCMTLTLGAVVTKSEVLIVGAGPYAVSGLYFGWVYLRFLHKNQDGSVGNTSDAFALTVLFPSFLKSTVGAIATFSYSVCKLMGFFKHRHDSASSLPVVAPTTDPITERRKARAMKALDEKLAKLANPDAKLNFDEQMTV
ncbi:hypothetical protein SDRG_06564 [Saprolegnia diclina VS20]|uniref:Peptidase S54 rhomboid domain-containing protein n=1 Tax=Saprolegnia diclina (strain VS20) TaxID=1156394 RepID=T0QM64_SAPDV|nr:hypothetical protein SDRG_06564 [Saprolegnia diclina VS20]EQC35806.1 hypothetical protein SDRG_06564 [Saprolegnia diclina VS20]|eukprot:XP_008610568.1 hypothetical protein SDRG_06564 [Saprolegnia diclina VS20]